MSPDSPYSASAAPICTLEISAGSFSPVLIFWMSAATNGCVYCTAHHGALLRGETGDALFTEYLSRNYRLAELTPRQRAMLDFTVMVNRDAGAGTRILIDQLLGSARPVGYGNQPRSHNAVAAAVAQGRADWGVAISSVAALYGLGFLPLAPEHYDFLLVDSRRERPGVQAFLAALQEPSTKEQIRALGMEPADH